MRLGARTTDVGPPSHFLASGPRLGFGAWAIGGTDWGGSGDDAERLAVVQHALERGITFFDTAPTYGEGASEALLGRALRGDRARATIATKVGPRDDPRRSLEASLGRLRTEYVDLVQLHETAGDWERQLEQLHVLREEGKARAVGLCNATHLQLARALEIGPLATYQGPYNLIDRDVEQRDLPLCRQRGLPFLAYRPLASGLLTGKYDAPAAFSQGDHRRKLYWFKGREFERRRSVVAQLRPIAERLDLPLAGLALAWLLGQPGVTIVLAGARTRDQVDENLSGTRHVTRDTLSDIDRIVAAAFRLPQVTEALRHRAETWGERERFVVERLDGRATAEAVAAAWTDRGGAPMVAAQVKVFCDQLAEQGLVVTDNG